MDGALPALSGRDQFNARVAANVLGIIEREQQLGPELALDGAARQWLPGDQAGTAPQQLSQALAAREINTDSHFDYLKKRNFWSPRSIAPLCQSQSRRGKWQMNREGTQALSF